MTERARILAELNRLYRGYTDAGLAGALAREHRVCRLCGANAKRRDSWMEENGTAMVRVECSGRATTGCPWTRTLTDPTPPAGPRSPRRKPRKNGSVHCVA